MNKAVKIVLILLVIAIAIFWVAHHTHFEAMMRKLHGG